MLQQECIPVGCVPPARRPYLPGPGGTWSGGCTWSGGVPGPGGYLVWGVPGLGGVPGPGGVPGQGCTWSRGGGCTWSGGVYLVWGVYLVPGGVPGPRGCTWSGTPPPVNRITHTCKNITLPQLRCGR